MRTTVAVALAASAALSLSGAGASASEAPDPLSPFTSQALEWERCGSQQCSWLTVPLDYSDLAGMTIRLRISRVRASGPAESRLGSLVTNPGGPGAPGIEFANYLADVLDPALTSAYDIVGFDTRGVGASAPIACLTGRETTRWYRTDLSPDTARERALVMSRARMISDGCLERSPNIARHVGSTDTVRDMDILRAALGDDRLSFLGFSYGTYLGTRYAELFPDRVGRFVLDGGVDPSLDVMEISRDQSAGFQHAVTRFAADCAPRPTCPWKGGRAAALEGINALLASLESRPLPTGELPLVEAEALTSIFYAMYSPQLWPQLRSALGEAKRGNGRGLAAMAGQATDRIGPNRYATNMASAFPAIACWDAPPAPGATGLAAAARAWSADAEVPAMAQAMAWGNAPCSVWFGHSGEAPAPAQSSTTAPILLIGTVHDPATPYEWSVALHRQLSTSTLLTYRGDGHTVYGGLSRCIDYAVDAYLLQAVLPAPGTTCR